MSAHPPAAAADPDDTVVPPGNFNPQARGVPTGNGWTWLADAWALFRPAAGVWIGMVLVLAVITINLNTSFIGAGSGKTLYADARVLKDGRSMSFVEGEAMNEDGTLVAKATATVRVLHKEKR